MSWHFGVVTGAPWPGMSLSTTITVDHGDQVTWYGQIAHGGNGDGGAPPFTTESLYTDDDGYDVHSVSCRYEQLGTKTWHVHASNDNNDASFSVEIVADPHVPPPPPSPPPPIAFPLGQPQTWPDLTFVSVHEAEPGDRYLANAYAFHRDWGHAPFAVDSLEQLLERLARAQVRPRRIRLAAHGTPVALGLRFFKRSPVGLTAADLTAWSQDDVQGLRHSISGVGRSASSPISTQLEVSVVLDRLRDTRPLVLQPFEFNAAGEPQGATVDLLLAGTDALVNETGHFAVDGRRRVDEVRPALRLIYDLVSRRLATLGVYELAHMRRLYNAILRLGDVFSPRAQFNVTNESPALYVPALTAGVAAVRRGWRRKLDDARTNLDQDSFIDIEGCSTGLSVTFPNAVAEFFGIADQRPMVSAPTQFQWYGRSTTRMIYVEDHDFDDVAMHPPVRDAVIHWAQIAGITDDPEWEPDSAGSPRKERLRLQHYLDRVKVLPVAEEEVPGELSVTLFVDLPRDASVGEQFRAGLRVDAETAETWLKSQWVPVPFDVVARLSRQWAAGVSPLATALNDVLAGSSVGVVAPDPEFARRHTRSER